MKKARSSIWVAIFGIWGFLLTGAFSSFIGTPGILQAQRLRTLLNDKQVQVNRIQDEIIRLQDEAVQLEKNKSLQEREIRRVLGYAASDELVFEF